MIGDTVSFVSCDVGDSASVHLSLILVMVGVMVSLCVSPMLMSNVSGLHVHRRDVLC